METVIMNRDQRPRAIVKRAQWVLVCLGLLCGQAGHAGTFPAPEGADSVFGALSIATTTHGDTLLDIARAYDQGYREMKIANPEVDVLLPGHDTEVLIPSLFIRPDALHGGRPGIVVNVAELRLYHQYKAEDGTLKIDTFPISIGRQEWETPHGRATKVVAKVKDPSWYPPESVRKEHEEWGDPLPRVVPPGDDNPLGKHALRLGLPGYLIHGTNRPYGIGMRVTHGCLRMYPKDVEQMYALTSVGTEVQIVNEPFKVGRRGDELYLEAHPSLEGDSDATELTLSGVVDRIAMAMDGAQIAINWSHLKATVARRSGIPTLIGTVRAEGEALAAPQRTQVSGLAPSG